MTKSGKPTISSIVNVRRLCSLLSGAGFVSTHRLEECLVWGRCAKTSYSQAGGSAVIGVVLKGLCACGLGRSFLKNARDPSMAYFLKRGLASSCPILKIFIRKC